MESQQVLDVDRRTSITYQSLSDQIYETLKREIITCKLKPGERLLLGELARSFGASQTPIKDALRRLTGEGLVETLPHRGTFVTALSQESLREIIEVRLVLEQYAGQVVIEKSLLTPTNVSALRAVVAELKKALELGDEDGFWSADRRFHALLVELAGNRKLAELHASLSDNLGMIRFYAYDVAGRAGNTTREHEKVVDALVKGDLPGFRDSLEKHIMSSWADLVSSDSDIGSRGTTKDGGEV